MPSRRRWNFNKYLVDRRGRVVARFGAGNEPDASELTQKLEAVLCCRSVRTRTYVPVVSAGRIPPRLQGDLGELSALAWLADQGAEVFLPIGHSRDIDLIAIFGEKVLRVQVKTSTVVLRNRRYEVTLATRGGNQSWNGLVKRFSSERCDYLFVHVGDGRRWFIPSAVVDGGSAMIVGGPKYAAFEVDRGRSLSVLAEQRLARLADSGGVPERSKGSDCKSDGSAFAGSNPAPAIASLHLL